MNKNRLEAFSDGVLAIIITIMVLEIKMPHTDDWGQLQLMIPVVLSYFLSFVFVGIYWVNHHHLLHAVKQVSSGMLWANLNLLFWLSLIPLATGWMGETHFAPNAVAVYGALLLSCGIAFTGLQKMAERHLLNIDELNDAFSNLKKKGIVSTLLYSISIPLAYVNPHISEVLFVCVSIIWFIPDKRIEKALQEKKPFGQE